MASTDVRRIIARRHREITERGQRIAEEVQDAFDEIRQGTRRTEHRFTLGEILPPAQKNQD